eukprot:CAMPEP_0169125952 /NCGR_PEP_ID=MMETSP1015-20121227/35173_1 /TAXON_ID=342587 /ORGANISM="Karlodinium micrum, Strain CCMP2283" /LENGTH=322 /DNA_ID=CAMNT_0009189551 /DNA_START=75 /DNA_END=1043 /DNA_ORIENTATION=-
MVMTHVSGIVIFVLVHIRTAVCKHTGPRTAITRRENDFHHDGIGTRLFEGELLEADDQREATSPAAPSKSTPVRHPPMRIEADDTEVEHDRSAKKRHRSKDMSMVMQPSGVLLGVQDEHEQELLAAELAASSLEGRTGKGIVVVGSGYDRRRTIFGMLDSRRRRYSSHGSVYGGPHPTPTTTPAPINCVWRDWDDWLSCSETCGGGDMTRSRSVEIAPKHQGTECEGPPEESTACEEQECPTTTPPTTTTTKPKGEVAEETEGEGGFPQMVMIAAVGGGLVILLLGGGICYFMSQQGPKKNQMMDPYGMGGGGEDYGGFDEY